jgi:hypothetical protein
MAHSRIPFHSSLSTKQMKIFGKTLQTPVRDHNRPLGLRHGRLMMMMKDSDKMYTIMKHCSNKIK